MTRYRNNIGLLRLIFASSVIVSHAPVMIDGTDRREPLFMVFGTVMLGDLSVDAFFLISGYLITMSWLKSSSLGAYLTRRFLRIWPAYIVVCLVCTLVVAPLVGGTPWGAGIVPVAKMVAFLGPINTPEQLNGLPYPVLNGALYTIPFEFGCYLVVAALGLVGVLARRRVVVALAAAALTALNGADVLRPLLAPLGHPGLQFFVVGFPTRLLAMFLTGAVGYLYRDEVARIARGRLVAASLVACAAMLVWRPTASPGLATFGGLVLFWTAFRADLGRLQRINDSWDLSYGTYLYGWPIAITVLHFHPRSDR